jgi:CheY-like chemotaxis protein
MLPVNVRTLVVDDNQTDRLLVRKILERMGLQDVQLAEDGSIAESKITNAEQTGRPFQLIVLDWNMPVANGLKVLRLVRGSKLSRSAKVIIMTATAEASVVEAAIMNGANDFIVKPVVGNTLHDKLQKLYAPPKPTT